MKRSKIDYKSLSFCHYCDWIWNCKNKSKRCKTYKKFAKSKPSKVKRRRQENKFNEIYD